MIFQLFGTTNGRFIITPLTRRSSVAHSILVVRRIKFREDWPKSEGSLRVPER
jgi:hypothetical protein